MEEPLKPGYRLVPMPESVAVEFEKMMAHLHSLDPKSKPSEVEEKVFIIRLECHAIEFFKVIAKSIVIEAGVGKDS